MLLGGVCENLESVHETEDEIRHKAIFIINEFLQR
jgi:hypothetical protein